MLLEALSSDKIYYFIFNYSADFEGDDAFLVSNENEIFVIVGKSADLEFIGLEENEQELMPEETQDEVEDELDFAMF